MSRIIVRSLFILLLVDPSLQGAVVPGRWEKVEKLARGRCISLALKSGSRIEGVFDSVNKDSLSLSAGSGSLLSVPKGEIQSVRALRLKRDRWWDGALLGAGIGTGIGAAVGAAGDDLVTGDLMGAGLAMGALVGFLIDWGHRATKETWETLYRARVPNPEGHSLTRVSLKE